MANLERLAASRVAISLVLAVGISACATGPTAHWEKQGGDEPSFRADNERCGEVASRVGSACSAAPGSCGTTAPPNHMNRPPHMDANPVWQRAFMECMAGRGWRVAKE